MCSLCNYQTYALYHLSQITCLDAELITDEAKSLAQSIYMKKKMYYNMRMKTLKRNATNVMQEAEEIFKQKLSSVNVTLNMLLKKKKDVEGFLEMNQYMFVKGEASESDDESVNSVLSSVDSTTSSITSRGSPATSNSLSSPQNFDEYPPHVSKPKATIAKPFTPSQESALIKKIHALSNAITVLKTHVKKLEKILDYTKVEVSHTSTSTIKRLMLEFHTGGNIRVEEGSSSDVWYNSCIDLVHSRLSMKKDYFSLLKIGSVRVNRITRIHNRFLRHRFETTVREIINKDKDGKERDGKDKDKDSSSTSGKVPKRMLEYLFYGTPPSLTEQTGQNEEIIRVAEDGFRAPEEYKSFGCDESITLNSTIDGADDLRLQSLSDMQQEEDKYLRSPDASSAPIRPPITGQILLVKTFVGDREEIPAPSSPNEKINASDFNNYNSAYHITTSLVSIAPSATTPAVDANSQASSSNHQPKTWHVFNPALALPEYLIDFEYLRPEFKGESEAGRSKSLNLLKKELARKLGGVKDPTELECIDMIPFLFPLSSFSETIEKSCDNYSKTRDDLYSNALSMPPKIPPKSKLFLMTEEAIMNFASSPSLSKIMYLNLHGHCLRKIENLTSCVSLEVLILSFNELNKIENLSGLRSLQRLELGFNFIKRISGLTGLVKLKHIELNNNLLNRLEDVHALANDTPNVEVLDLSNNPICKARSYKSAIFKHLKNIKCLDTLSVNDHDRKNLLLNPSTQTLTTNMIKQFGFGTSKSGIDGDRPGLRDGAGDGIEWMNRVEELDLSNQQLQYISGLDHLHNLRRCCLSDNEISVIEGLEKNLRLEDLNLENNRIASIDNIFSLVRLKKLELGHNRISKIPALDMFSKLTQLSLENNEITSIKSIKDVPSLMELYMGNNAIEDISEINHLKTLPRLIILDVSGNPFCNVESTYRLFIIYMVKKLKVLDGVGVSQGEAANAKEKYCGKLTRENVAEKAGHTFFEHIREINLSGCKLRDVDILGAPEFKNLRELNLDNNHMSTLESLAGLTNLSILRLNYNRIEGLFGPRRAAEDGIRNSSSRASLNGSASTASLASVNTANNSTSPLPTLQLHNLEVLHLGYNKITNIKGLMLDNFPNLRALYLTGNDISKVDGLQSCGELRELVLDKNRIRGFDPHSLANLKKLQDLRIEENGLRSLSNFPVLPCMTVLSVAGNRINDIIELEKLCRVCDAKEVSFVNNPVTRKQLYRTSVVNMFPNIRIIDGREVGSEERERALHLMHGGGGGGLASNMGVMGGVGNFLQQQILQANNMQAGGGGSHHAPMGVNNFGIQNRDASPHQLFLEQQQHLQRSGKGQGGNNGGGFPFPYPKTTVKLTSVNFESFAGFQPSVAGGAGNHGNGSGFSAQPPASGGNNGGAGGGRLVWSSNEGNGGGGGNSRSNYTTYNMGARSRSLREGRSGGGVARKGSNFF